ncbi:MAG: hypothetical protein JRI23_01150 [Deltaproteobacteria bacterium]|nr:hypothetical protein [Deltaproteobacteria bacterium]MBW2530061.1 hypothetical protein [Deltaproteobacteria bacterium]
MSTSEAEVIVLQRILLVVLVLLVVWRLLAAFGRRISRTGHGADSYSRFSPYRRRRRREWTEGRSKGRPDELVACQRCGTYVPSQRALVSGSGAVFCGPDCRDRQGASAGHES